MHGLHAVAQHEQLEQQFCYLLMYNSRSNRAQAGLSHFDQQMRNSDKSVHQLGVQTLSLSERRFCQHSLGARWSHTQLASFKGAGLPRV
jgi:hypothetical protein